MRRKLTKQNSLKQNLYNVIIYISETLFITLNVLCDIIYFYIKKKNKWYFSNFKLCVYGTWYLHKIISYLHLSNNKIDIWVHLISEVYVKKIQGNTFYINGSQIQYFVHRYYKGKSCPCITLASYWLWKHLTNNYCF